MWRGAEPCGEGPPTTGPTPPSPPVPPFLSTREGLSQGNGPIRYCPPPFTPHPRPGLSPAHCLWTNQRVGHLGSTRPRRTKSWAQSGFKSRPPKRDLVHAQSLRVFTSSPVARHKNSHCPVTPVLNVALTTPLPEKFGVSGTLPMTRGQDFHSGSKEGKRVSCGFREQALPLGPQFLCKQLGKPTSVPGTA